MSGKLNELGTVSKRVQRVRKPKQFPGYEVDIPLHSQNNQLENIDQEQQREKQLPQADKQSDKKTKIHALKHGGSFTVKRRKIAQYMQTNKESTIPNQLSEKEDTDSPGFPNKSTNLVNSSQFAKTLKGKADSFLQKGEQNASAQKPCSKSKIQNKHESGNEAQVNEKLPKALKSWKNCDKIKKLVDEKFDSDDNPSFANSRKKPDLSYECKTLNCSKVFITLKEMIAHKKLVHKTFFRYICSECEKEFGSFAFYRSHLRMDHSDINSVKFCLKDIRVIARDDSDLATCRDVLVCTKCCYRYRESDDPNHDCELMSLLFYCPCCTFNNSEWGKMAEHISETHTGEYLVTLDTSTQTDSHVSTWQPGWNINESKNVCEICNWIFESKAEHKQHMNTKHASHPFACGLCKKCYGRKVALNKHLITHRKADLTCTLCKEEFLNKFRLDTHMLTHTESRPYQCETCGNRFVTEKDVKTHFLLKHELHSKTDKPAKQLSKQASSSSTICPFCGKTYSSDHALTKHLKTHKKPKTFKCPECDITFSEVLALKQHRLVHQTLDFSKLGHIRTISSATMKEVFNKIRVFEEGHPSGRPYKCGICEKRFGKIKALHLHIRGIHLKEEDKNYVCGICKRGFTMRSSCQTHMRLHTFSKPYKCRLCDKQFRQLGHIKSHLLAHGKPQLQCVLCKKMFTTRAYLIQHIKTHCKILPFKCPVKKCTTAFHNLYSLLKHFSFCQEHVSGNTTLECNFCRSSFSKEEIASHIHNHENDVTFPCESCDMSFRNYLDLFFHKEEQGHFLDSEFDKTSHTRIENSMNSLETVTKFSEDELMSQFDYIEDVNVGVPADKGAIQGKSNINKQADERETDIPLSTVEPSICKDGGFNELRLIAEQLTYMACSLPNNEVVVQTTGNNEDGTITEITVQSMDDQLIEYQVVLDQDTALDVTHGHNVGPVSNILTAQPVCNLQTVETVSNLQSVEPVGNLQTMEPVSNLLTMEPVSNLQSWEPVGNIQTVEPVSNIQKVEPVGNIQIMIPVSNVQNVELVSNIQHIETVSDLQSVKLNCNVQSVQPVGNIQSIDPVRNLQVMEGASVDHTWCYGENEVTYRAMVNSTRDLPQTSDCLPILRKANHNGALASEQSQEESSFKNDKSDRSICNFDVNLNDNSHCSNTMAIVQTSTTSFMENKTTNKIQTKTIDIVQNDTNNIIQNETINSMQNIMRGKIQGNTRDHIQKSAPVESKQLDITRPDGEVMPFVTVREHVCEVGARDCKPESQHIFWKKLKLHDTGHSKIPEKSAAFSPQLRKLSKNDSILYQCTSGSCSKIFLRMSKLSLHKKIFHNEILKQHCQQCGKEFCNFHTFKSHLRMKHMDKDFVPFFIKNTIISIDPKNDSFGEKMLVCTQCGYRCGDLEDGAHLCQPEGPCFYCPCGSYQSEHLSEVRKHIMDEHGKNFEGTMNDAERSSRKYSDKHLRQLDSKGEATCNRCNITYGTKKELKQHLKIKHAARPFACGVCKWDYRIKNSLMNHMLTHKIMDLKCNVCQKEFSKKRRLDVHMMLHNQEKPYQCKLCGNSFLEKKSLKKHTEKERFGDTRMNTDTTNVNSKKRLPFKRAFVCDVCGKQFSVHAHLKRHIFCKHKTEEQKFQCPHCDLRFAEIYAFKHHKMSHQSVTSSFGGKPASVSNLKTLEVFKNVKHRDEGHASGLPYKCSCCDKRFRTLKGIQQHMLIKHIREADKRFVCELCQRGFQNQASFTIHMRLHNNIKPYKCRLCDKQFRQLGHIKSHLLVHGKPQLQCVLCRKMFKTRANLLQHVKTHCNILPYKCPVNDCTMTFLSLYSFLTHGSQCLKSLSPESPLSCKFCNNSFPAREILAHYHSHESDEKFACQVCEVSYSNYQHLYLHKEEKQHFAESEFEYPSHHVEVETRSDTQTADEDTKPSLSQEELLQQYDYVVEVDKVVDVDNPTPANTDETEDRIGAQVEATEIIDTDTLHRGDIVYVIHDLSKITGPFIQTL